MDQTALFKLSYGLYVVGVKNGDSFGGCIVDAMMQVTSDMPPLLMLGSMRNNLTNQLIRKTGELTISVLRADADPFLIANFGFQSARKVEKWENVEYAVKDGLPVLLDAASYLRCRVLEAKDLSTHTVYTCEVTDAWNGDGEPLLYSDYQKHMKDATRKAFQNFLNAKKVEHTVPEQEQKPQWVCSVCGYETSRETAFDGETENGGVSFGAFKAILFSILALIAAGLVLMVIQSARERKRRRRRRK